MRSLKESSKHYARGLTGGLIFSLPLIYTMEVWFAGQTVQSFELIIYLLIGFVLLIGYNRFAGLHPEVNWNGVILESIEELGMGIVLSGLILWLIGQIDLSVMSAQVIIGKLVVEAVFVAIGISIGKAQLGQGSEKEGKKENLRSNPGTAGKAALGCCGSIVIAGNIAPTEEIERIAMESTEAALIGMLLASLALGSIIMFFSDFKGSAKVNSGEARLLIATDTCLLYCISFATSAFMLWFFGLLDGLYFRSVINEIVVLSFPAMLGASAGRLLIK